MRACSDAPGRYLLRFCQNSNNILAKQLHFCYAYPIKRELNQECWPMNCPYCMVATTKKRTKKTKLGYTTFFCPHCRCAFNERTGTPFNYLEFPTDIVLLAVFWRLRYKLSLRDIAEMFLERGFTFTHEAIRDWEAWFAPLISDKLRTTRRGQAGKSWLLMRYTSRFMENGVTCIERLIVTATWLIHVSARQEIWLLPNVFLSKQSMSSALFPSR
jgi:transposase-like protein